MIFSGGVVFVRSDAWIDKNIWQEITEIDLSHVTNKLSLYVQMHLAGARAVRCPHELTASG
jgi:hypothetical protein